MRSKLIRLLIKLAKEEFSEEGKKPPSGKGRLSGKFLEFMKEMGDKPFTNPDTGNKVKLKSLKGPKGQKLVKSEFEKWLKEQEKKEKSKNRSPRKERNPPEGKPEKLKGKEEDSKEEDKRPEWLSTQGMVEFAKRVNPSREKWPSKSRGSVLMYTGHYYSDMNNFLRFGGDPSKDEDIRNMDSLFESPEGKLPEPMRVKRGIYSGNHPLVKMILNGSLKPGDSFVDKGYQSTSINNSMKWSEWTMDVHVPKGAEAIYVGDPPTSYSDHYTEKEIILNRGTEMEIESFDLETKTINLRVKGRKR